MKKVLFATLLIVSSLTQARQITINLPELTAEDKVFYNFDGSITVINPQVLVRGEYYSVTTSDEGTSTGLCVVYKKTKAVDVVSASEYLRSAEGENPVVAKISVEGTFAGFKKVTSGNQYWIDEITCY